MNICYLLSSELLQNLICFTILRQRVFMRGSYKISHALNCTVNIESIDTKLMGVKV